MVIGFLDTSLLFLIDDCLDVWNLYDEDCWKGVDEAGLYRLLLPTTLIVPTTSVKTQALLPNAIKRVR